MKKILLSTLLLAMTLLAGCGKDDKTPSNVIVASRVAGDTQNIDKVGVIISPPSLSVQSGRSFMASKPGEPLPNFMAGDSDEKQAESVPPITVMVDFTNNGFRLGLPETVSEAYLIPLSKFSPSAVISDRTASICLLSGIYALNYAEQLTLGEILCTDAVTLPVQNIRYIAYMYADKPFTQTGSAEGESYNLSLNKGWNKICVEISSTGNILCTSTIPSGLSWRVFTYQK